MFEGPIELITKHVNKNCSQVAPKVANFLNFLPHAISVTEAGTRTEKDNGMMMEKYRINWREYTGRPKFSHFDIMY